MLKTIPIRLAALNLDQYGIQIVDIPNSWAGWWIPKVIWLVHITQRNKRKRGGANKEQSAIRKEREKHPTLKSWIVDFSTFYVLLQVVKPSGATHKARNLA